MPNFLTWRDWGFLITGAVRVQIARLSLPFSVAASLDCQNLRYRWLRFLIRFPVVQTATAAILEPERGPDVYQALPQIDLEHQKRVHSKPARWVAVDVVQQPVRLIPSASTQAAVPSRACR